MLGASPWQTLRRVTLPLLGPSILGAALLVFLFDFTSYGVVRMLGRPGLGTLEVDIYTQAMYYLNLPVAGLLSIVQLIFTLLLTIMQNRVTSPRYGKAALASESRVLHPPRGLGQKLLAGFLILIILLMVVMPLGSLVTRSLVTLDAERGQRGGIEAGFTLRYYPELFVNRTGTLFYVPPLPGSSQFPALCLPGNPDCGCLGAAGCLRAGGQQRCLGAPGAAFHAASGYQRGHAGPGLFGRV